MSSSKGVQQQQARGPRVFKYDAVSRLAQIAPCWIVIISFDCRDYVPTMQVMESSRLLELYTSKVLSRSTCLAGLLNSTRPLLSTMTHVPAAFFRPLEYILELCDSGSFYRPITPEDLQAGLPPPHWCLPLHMQLHQQAMTRSLQQLQCQEYGTMQSLATAALNPAQYWCLVHKYHEGAAKCDFNWHPRDLVSGLISKSVSPFTLVLGLNEHKDRNLPWMRPSLFIPLAAVLHQQQSGISYMPLTRNDLHMFNVLGFKGAMATVLETGIVPAITDEMAAQLVGTAGSGEVSGDALSMKNSSANTSKVGSKQSVDEHMPAGLAPEPPGMSSPPSSNLQNPEMALNSGVLSGLISVSAPESGPGSVVSMSGSLPMMQQMGISSNSADHQSMQDASRRHMLRAMGQMANSTLVQLVDPSPQYHAGPGIEQLHQMFYPSQPAHAYAPAFQPGQTYTSNHFPAAKPQVLSKGLDGFQWATGGVKRNPPGTWSTPLFQLFSADAGGPMPPPASHWWLLDASSSIQGPLTSEQMMIGYMKGLVDDGTLVCGTQAGADDRSAVPPPPGFFQPMANLLEAVQGGSTYNLLTVHPAADQRALERGGLTATYAASGSGQQAFVVQKPLSATHALALQLQQTHLHHPN